MLVIAGGIVLGFVGIVFLVSLFGGRTSPEELARQVEAARRALK